MTRRHFQELVKEINSELKWCNPIPFSARSGLQLTTRETPKASFTRILESLGSGPIEKHFQVPYEKAIRAIKECLSAVRTPKASEHGSLAWLDHERGYGFIDYEEARQFFSFL